MHVSSHQYPGGVFFVITPPTTNSRPNLVFTPLPYVCAAWDAKMTMRLCLHLDATDCSQLLKIGEFTKNEKDWL